MAELNDEMMTEKFYRRENFRHRLRCKNVDGNPTFSVTIPSFFRVSQRLGIWNGYFGQMVSDRVKNIWWNEFQIWIQLEYDSESKSSQPPSSKSFSHWQRKSFTKPFATDVCEFQIMSTSGNMNTSSGTNSGHPRDT
ncbi:hypothetical protein QQ045_025972 [Rhodiola kirilowii]